MSNNQLIQYVNREVSTPRTDREVVKAAKKVHDQVRLAGFKAEGVAALAAHSMQQIVQLDQIRRDLADGDPILGQLLAEIEMSAVRSVKAINQNVYNEWGF